MHAVCYKEIVVEEILVQAEATLEVFNSGVGLGSMR